MGSYLFSVSLYLLQREDENRIISELAAIGIKFKKLSDIYLAQPTPVDDELQMMAACLAYHKVVAHFATGLLRFLAFKSRRASVLVHAVCSVHVRKLH